MEKAASQGIGRAFAKATNEFSFSGAERTGVWELT
jgi:hypothetical protein